MEKFPVDLLVRGARVFNAFRRDFRDWDVAVLDGRFFYCGTEDSASLEPAAVVDATGLWLVPGLIDIHMHIESSMVTPQAFAWALARDGVNIKVITTSEIKVSVLIDRKYMELAVQALHDAFDLDKAT